MAESVSFRAEIDDYTNRVLGVVKEKFGLRDKSEALKKFTHMFGDDFVEKEVREEYIAEVMSIINEHHKKYPKRRMTIEELDRLTGV